MRENNNDWTSGMLWRSAIYHTAKSGSKQRAAIFCLLASLLALTTVRARDAWDANTSFDSNEAPYDNIIAKDGFEPDTGVFLSGPSEIPAINALIDIGPVPARSTDILEENGLLLTRLEAWLDSSATVGQVNAGLSAIGGGILTMTPGHAGITISIPRAADQDSLEQVQQTLQSYPGFLYVGLAQMPAPQLLPPSPGGEPGHIGHLFASRFPAAWNTSYLATNGCESRKVEMRVMDYFAQTRPPSHQAFADEVRTFGMVWPATSLTTILHGYDVTTTALARGNVNPPTGANPFPQCVRVRGVATPGLSEIDAFKLLHQSLPDHDNVVINISLGRWSATCAGGCSAVEVQRLRKSVNNGAFIAMEWKSVMQDRESNVLWTHSAGNDYEKGSAIIYPFFGRAEFNFVGAASSPGVFGNPMFQGFQDHSLLDAHAPDSGGPSLVQNDFELAAARTLALQTFGSNAVPAKNILTVGSTNNFPTTSFMQQSNFSNRPSDVQAVGEQVYTLSGLIEGTSFSAPQVAGMVTYLWLLSDDLRSKPVTVTRAAILANTQVGPDGVNLIDAYATVLSLDEADPAIVPSPSNMPIRLSLLDLDNSGTFTDSDLDEFSVHLIDDVAANGEPQEQTWSRHDLNGDGFTGGNSHKARFDLDRRQSTRYGSTRYDLIQQTIEGGSIKFNEAALTDLDVLCYYAYSPLYTGSAAERTRLLATPCAARFPPVQPMGGFHTQAVGSSLLTSFVLGYYEDGTHPGQWVRKLDWQSRQWSADEQILPTSGPLQPYAGASNIVVSDTGEALVYGAASNNTLWARRYDRSTGHWRDAEQVGVGAPITPSTEQIAVESAFVDDDGNAMILFRTRESITHVTTHWSSYFEADLGQWSTAIAVSPPESDFQQYRLVLSGQMYSYTPQGQIYVFDTLDVRWLLLASAPFLNLHTPWVVPNENNIHVVWQDGRRLLTGRYDFDSGVWSSVQEVTSVPEGSTMVMRSVVMSSISNDLFVLWTEESGSTSNLWTAHYTAGAAEWESPIQINEEEGAVSFSAMNMNHGTGSADVVWTQRMTGYPYHFFDDTMTRRFTPNGGWGPITQLQNGLDYQLGSPIILTSNFDEHAMLLGVYFDPPQPKKNFWQILH